MAINKDITGVSLRILSNYGAVDGKELKRSKTYSNVKEEASDENIMATYNAITQMQQPIGEVCNVITTATLTETV